MSDELVFCEPPSRDGGSYRGKWLRTLEPLCARPNEWARLPGHFSRAMVSQLLRTSRGGGGTLRFPAGRWEFRGRAVPDVPAGRVAVWARYLGAGVTQ
jgi:hypothetical protein